MRCSCWRRLPWGGQSGRKGGVRGSHEGKGSRRWGALSSPLSTGGVMSLLSNESQERLNGGEEAGNGQHEGV